MKKALIFGFFLALVLVFSKGAYAAGDTVQNKNTGPSSINIAKIKRISIVKATTFQEALVFNDVTTTQNTGGNIVIGNTSVSGTNIKSGNTSSSVGIVNNVNTAIVTVNGCDGCGMTATVKNENTGPLSVNIAKVEEVSVTKATTDQSAIVFNTVSSDQNTGGNVVIGNTLVAGTGSTGNATTTVGIANNINGAEITVGNPTP